jgi:hypothetical protein
MKNTKKMIKPTASRESLADRLTAYSVMAGAALAFMPAADGARALNDVRAAGWPGQLACPGAGAHLCAYAQEADYLLLGSASCRSASLRDPDNKLSGPPETDGRHLALPKKFR